MDVDQRTARNPFGMDEECRHCEALCAVREGVLHGYGDVGAEFLFVGEAPAAASERTGVPFTGDAAGERLQSILGRVGLSNSLPSSERPELPNAYLTHLTRCRHPGRGPTDEEVRNCEPFLNAEIRMINPEVIVPVGERALRELAAEFTTAPAEQFSVATHHATEIRGRGFLLVPMRHPAEQTDADADAFVEAFRALLASDYRQTKGRRSR